MRGIIFSSGIVTTVLKESVYKNILNNRGLNITRMQRIGNLYTLILSTRMVRCLIPLRHKDTLTQIW